MKIADVTDVIKPPIADDQSVKIRPSKRGLDFLHSAASIVLGVHRGDFGGWSGEWGFGGLRFRGANAISILPEGIDMCGRHSTGRQGRAFQKITSIQAQGSYLIFLRLYNSHTLGWIF